HIHPRPSQDIPLACPLRPGPLPDITRHIVGAHRAEGRALAHANWSGCAKIAERYDVDSGRRTGRPVPLVIRRQTLACKLRVRGGFVPTHPAYWEIFLAFGVPAGFPG